MLEIPESYSFARQAADMLSGRTVTDVFNATHPHKFTWYLGDPADYRARLVGKTVRAAEGHGAFIDLLLDDETHIALSDGVNLRYHAPGAEVPPKYQLLIAFDDDSFLVFTVAMYGGIIAFRKHFDNPYYLGALSKPSPLDDAFDEACFGWLISDAKSNLSAKAFLATEQRIPGLGNGVLQDILFKSHIHPKRRLATLGDAELGRMYSSVKSTLRDMADRGGRDTEKDLLGQSGGYKTLLSKNTFAEPWPGCGGAIVKEAYLGGAVYYCPVCQPLIK